MLNLPKCPFCKGKISFLEAFIYKNKPYFKCSYCGNFSHAVFKPGLFIFIIFSAILLAGTFLLGVLFEKKFLFIAIIIDILICLIFYSFTPAMLIFEPSAYVRKKSLNFKKNKSSDILKNSIDDKNDTFQKTIRDDEVNENDIFSN